MNQREPANLFEMHHQIEEENKKAKAEREHAATIKAVLPLYKSPRTCYECKYIEAVRIANKTSFVCQELIQVKNLTTEEAMHGRQEDCPLIDILQEGSDEKSD